MNAIYDEIVELFESAGVENFEKLPDELSERGKFAKLFKQFNEHLEAAKIQGFVWGKMNYDFGTAELSLDENAYLVLALRYKELSGEGGAGSGGSDDVPFEIDGYLTEIDTGKIDADFMNTRFDKYLKTLKQEGSDGDHVQKTLDELHKSFSSLTQEEQKYANIFLHDVQSGDAVIDSNKTFREHITEYLSKAKNTQIADVSEVFGLDVAKLNTMMNTGINESNINEYGRFDDLKNSVDKAKAKAYFEQLEGASIPLFKVNMKVDKLLQAFIISGGFDLEIFTQ